MKNRILNKLRSRRGASITYALLLFLVCAVLCSVIITAGTTAAGRMSKMAETDQRYYAVTSAAELLTDMIDDGTTVRIVEVETDGRAGDPSYYGGNEFQREIAERYYAYKTTGDTTNLTNTLTLDVSENSDSIALLAVTVTEKVGMDGSLTLTLYNTYASEGVESVDGKNRYTVKMTFDIENKNRNVIVESYDYEEVNEETGEITYHSKNITTTKLTWKLTGIQSSS